MAKDYLWGDTRLNDNFAKGINMEPLAETWECSTHPDGVSAVASGKHKGKLLSDVLSDHPFYLGTHPESDGDLPILIKLIDAKICLCKCIRMMNMQLLVREDSLGR